MNNPIKSSCTTHCTAHPILVDQIDLIRSTLNKLDEETKNLANFQKPYGTNVIRYIVKLKNNMLIIY